MSAALDMLLGELPDVDPAKVERWQAGEHVQNVWPELSADERELLITGTHPTCWDDLWRLVADPGKLRRWEASTKANAASTKEPT